MSRQLDEPVESYACGEIDMAVRGGLVDADPATCLGLTQEHRDLAVDILPHRALLSAGYQDIMSVDRVSLMAANKWSRRT